MMSCLIMMFAIVAASLTGRGGAASHLSVVNDVATGSCVQVGSDENEHCAMQSSDCEPSHIDGSKNVLGEQWYSAYRQEQRGSVNQCRCESTSIGACVQTTSISNSKSDTSDNAPLSVRCAAHEGLCRAEETFLKASSEVPQLSDCKCDHGGAGTNELPTKYGACVHKEQSRDEYFCAYRREDCQGTHYWMEPTDVPEEYECHCGNVRTGGCVGGFMKFQCAATPDDCSFDRYLAPADLKRLHGYSCRLCDADAVGLSLSTDEIDGISQQKNIPMVPVLITVALVILVAAGAGLLLFKRRQRTPTSALEEDKDTIRDGDQTEGCSIHETNDIVTARKVLHNIT